MGRVRIRCLLCILWSVLLVCSRNAFFCWRLDGAIGVVVLCLAVVHRRYRLDEDGPLPSEKLMFCLLLGCGWEARLTSWWLCGI